MNPDSFVDRMVLSMARHRGLDRPLLAVLRKASELLGLVVGLRIAQMRDTGEPVLALSSKVEAQALLLKALGAAAELLGARWEKVPASKRPHFTAEQRFRILWVKDVFALSLVETARLFRVDKSTIARWSAERKVDPGSTTVGSLLKPVPPVRRYADVVRHLVQSMGTLGFGGSEQIARMLTRAGWKLSKRTVARVRKEKPVPAPSPVPSSTGRTVVTRYPNHVLMMDLTTIPSLFRIFSLKLGLVIDAFSRMPLAAKLFFGEPSAEQMAELFTSVVTRLGKARHLVTDQGSQFIADVFREIVKAAGTRQRFGAVGKTGSIAVIERMIKTLKGILRVPLQPGMAIEDQQRRVELALLWYAYARPHRALGGATPAEVYFGIKPAHLAAVTPPRGRPGDQSKSPPFEVAFLDPEERLPMLVPRAA